MKTTISLNELLFKANHGFYEEERIKGNDFVVNISVEVKSFDSNDDNIHDTVNYEKIFLICEEEMLKTKKLLESVVFSIIQRLKNELKHIAGGSVSLKKLNPPIKGNIASAEVKMEF